MQTVVGAGERVSASSCSRTSTSFAGSSHSCSSVLAPRRQPTRRQLNVAAAYAPSLPAHAQPAAAAPGPQLTMSGLASSMGSGLASSMGSGLARPSLDPLSASWEQAWEPGRLFTVKSPEQFSELLKQQPDTLVVLMCKSHSCRPCKMFTRKYLSIAQRFPDCILAEIYGDETPETRKMMMQMDVRVTPTFRMYRQGGCVNVVSGTSEKKLMRGMLSAMTAAELAAHQQEVADTMSFDEAEQQQQQLAPVQAGSSSS